MRDAEEPRISVVIMHHPARAGHVDAIVRACAPLPVQVVADPDPAGPRSPLRTAKVAWAAVPVGATHHLVLQDDVLLTEQFATHLRNAVAHRPDHGVALYVNGSGPQNSYLARRAAAVGSPWAPLSPVEWTPTQGLVLPARHALDLAGYLRTIPDEVVDDDEMIVIFCRERGIPVLAVLPNLLDHAGLPTLVEHYERNRAVMFVDWWVPSREYWAGNGDLEAELAVGSELTARHAYTVEFTDSRCLLRFVRSESAEPVEHPYGWYWHDWCHLVGVEPDRIVEDCAAHLRAPAPRVAVEVWAAGYLLGADSARFGTPSGRRHGSALVGGIRSWVAAGLSTSDNAALDAAARSELTALGLAAVDRGARQTTCAGAEVFR